MLFQINSLSYAYKTKKVLDCVCLNIKKGKFYGIIGPNGCGKTTFIDIISGIKKNIFGEIYYKDKKLSHYSKKLLAKEIAVIPQNFYVNFPFTVKEIIIMGRYPYISRFSAPCSNDFYIIDEIMKKTDIYELKNNYITNLSGGERQRVVFARALAQNTPVLIMDEATSNLDINYTLNLLNIVSKDVNDKGKTVICVMHDINLASMYCHELIFMQNGKIIFNGSVDETLNSDTIKDVFNVDSKVYFDSYSNSKQIIFKK